MYAYCSLTTSIEDLTKMLDEEAAGWAEGAMQEVSACEVQE